MEFWRRHDFHRARTTTPLPQTREHVVIEEYVDRAHRARADPLWAKTRQRDGPQTKALLILRISRSEGHISRVLHGRDCPLRIAHPSRNSFASASMERGRLRGARHVSRRARPAVHPLPHRQPRQLGLIGRSRFLTVHQERGSRGRT